MDLPIAVCFVSMSEISEVLNCDDSVVHYKSLKVSLIISSNDGGKQVMISEPILFKTVYLNSEFNTFTTSISANTVKVHYLEYLPCLVSFMVLHYFKQNCSLPS